MKILRLAALATLVVFAACARATSAASGTTVASIDRNFCPRASATLYVTNDGWADVVIYIYRGGSRYRLGDVTAVQQAVFMIPETVMGGGNEIGVYVDPIGSFDGPDGIRRGFSTGNIPIQPGHTAIDLRVANILNQSSYSYGVESPEVI